MIDSILVAEIDGLFVFYCHHHHLYRTSTHPWCILENSRTVSFQEAECGADGSLDRRGE